MTWSRLLAPAVLITAIYFGVNAYETGGHPIYVIWCALACLFYTRMLDNQEPKE